MIGKRTEIDFSKHEVIVQKNDLVSIYYLKKPNTVIDSIKYINCEGIMSVTGDYGNWIFCREFHPNERGGVSDGYWIEKLKIASSQEPLEFDKESTEKELLQRLEDYKNEMIQLDPTKVILVICHSDNTVDKFLMREAQKKPGIKSLLKKTELTLEDFVKNTTILNFYKSI